MIEARFPMCIHPDYNPEGYRRLYIASKEIGEFAKTLPAQEFLLAVIPLAPDPESQETIYSSVNGAWSSVDVAKGITKALVGQYQFGRLTLPDVVSLPLFDLAAAINSFWKDTERQYWLAFLPPTGGCYAGNFWLNGQQPDYSGVPYDVVIAMVAKALSRYGD